MLFKFGKVRSSLCSFHKTIHKTPIQLFHEYHIANQLGKQLKCSSKDESNFPPLTPKSAIFGLTNLTNNISLMKHLLLILKLYVYSTTEKIQVSIIQLKSVTNKINDLSISHEKSLSIKSNHQNPHTPRSNFACPLLPLK